VKQRIQSQIGFSDAEFRSYAKDNDNFTVVVEAWNQAHLKVIFFGVIGIIDRNIGSISDLVMDTDESEFVMESIALMYDRPPTIRSYNLYQFLDLDDRPVLEVVALRLEIVI
jgi:hypothetical protein